MPSEGQTKDEIKFANHVRLVSWGEDLDSIHAKAILLVGVIRLEKGRKVYCCTDAEMPRGELIELLRHAMQSLEGADGGGASES